MSLWDGVPWSLSVGGMVCLLIGGRWDGLPVVVSFLDTLPAVRVSDVLPVAVDWWPLDVLPVCEPVPWSVPSVLGVGRMVSLWDVRHCSSGEPVGW